MTGTAQQRFYNEVLVESARLLDCDVGGLTVDAATFDVVSQCQTAGESVVEVARQLVIDGVVRTAT